MSWITLPRISMPARSFRVAGQAVQLVMVALTSESVVRVLDVVWSWKVTYSMNSVLMLHHPTIGTLPSGNHWFKTVVFSPGWSRFPRTRTKRELVRFLPLKSTNLKSCGRWTPLPPWSPSRLPGSTKNQTMSDWGEKVSLDLDHHSFIMSMIHMHLSFYVLVMYSSII